MNLALNEDVLDYINHIVLLCTFLEKLSMNQPGEFLVARGALFSKFRPVFPIMHF